MENICSPGRKTGRGGFEVYEPNRQTSLARRCEMARQAGSDVLLDLAMTSGCCKGHSEEAPLPKTGLVVPRLTRNCKQASPGQQ